MLSELENISRIWKAGRLLGGWTQKELARQLGISQSNISKYESQLLEPSASDWFRFCELVGIDAHRSLLQGFIDGRKKFKNQLYPDSLFYLPVKYRGDFLLKIREFVPFREVIVAHRGHKEWSAFVEKHGLVEEMFYVLDFQVSYRLLLDLLEWFRFPGLELSLVVPHVAASRNIHTMVGEDFLSRKHPADLLRTFLDHQGFYQRALESFHQISENEITGSLTFSKLGKQSFASDELGTLLDYKINLFKELLDETAPNTELVVERNDFGAQVRIAI